MRPLLRLALPIVAVQLGMRAMTSVDMIMLGHMPASIGDPEHSMAAAALGNAWSWVPTIFAIGTLMACDPLFSQAVGARDDDAVNRTFQRGIALALLWTVPVMAIAWQVDWVMENTQQPPELLDGAAIYARTLAFGHLPLLVYGVLRQALQAHSILRPLLVTIVCANVFNVGANWVLIRGGLGFEPMGLEGSARATVASRWLMTLLLLAVSWRTLGPRVRSFADRDLRARALRIQPLLRMTALGLPIGIGLGLELGIFAATTLTVGPFGPSYAAGHQATLDIASTSFMIPMGLGAAAAVLVGRAIGEGNMERARRVAACSLLLASAIMGAFAVLFLAAPRLLGSLYLDPKHAVNALAVIATLMPVAAIFQVFDGLQVVAAGVLRGMGDTQVPMFVNVLGFWALGFPAGLWLTYRAGLGPAGMWWGLVIGLASVAAGLLVLMRARIGRERARVLVD